jgi:hypothetical protein
MYSRILTKKPKGRVGILFTAPKDLKVLSKDIQTESGYDALNHDLSSQVKRKIG